MAAATPDWLVAAVRPAPARIRRITVAATFGGAAGLCLGELVHGRGWLEVVLVVGVAGVSALLTGASATVSITGLQLLVYTILGTGPLGALRPWWWWWPLLLLAGVAWAILLLIPGWLVSPLSAERRSTAGAYGAIAGLLRAAGTPRFPQAHEALVAALNAAWDDLASRRAYQRPGPRPGPPGRPAEPDPSAHRGGGHPGPGRGAAARPG